MTILFYTSNMSNLFLPQDLCTSDFSAERCSQRVLLKRTPTPTITCSCLTMLYFSWWYFSSSEVSVGCLFPLLECELHGGRDLNLFTAMCLVVKSVPGTLWILQKNEWIKVLSSSFYEWGQQVSKEWNDLPTILQAKGTESGFTIII